MNGQQTPAPKPIHLAPKTPSITPSKSPIALHGATTAFLPRSVAPTVNGSSASSGARLAACAAGTPVQQRKATAKTPESKYGRLEPSPPRGRQPHANTHSLPTTLKSPASHNTPSSTIRPILQSRSPSTLAACHATDTSRSPDRNQSKSWETRVDTTSSMRQNQWEAQRKDALAGATASMVGRTTLTRAHTGPKSVKTRALNFEKLPILTSPTRPPVLDGTVDKNNTVMDVEPARRRQITDRNIDINRLGETEMPNDSTVVKLDALPGIVRQSSEESAVTIATTTTGGISKLEESSQSGQFPISASLSSRPSYTKSPPHDPVRNNHDYRKMMTVNALADAMVASSLASSRATSPAKGQPPPAARRRSRSATALYEIGSQLPSDIERRTLKTARPMKHTLRKPAVSDDEGPELTKRGRRHWMRKHPNQHSEGDRKRWRDKITDPERKRYEGVFAANRGLLIGSGHFEPSPSALSDNKTLGNHVVNVVVRDIWERSRLPREVLKEIYDLVSPEEAQALNREQFVVGLWLVDQRLKGRKLPVKVSTSVWASVRLSQGIKIKGH